MQPLHVPMKKRYRLTAFVVAFTTNLKLGHIIHLLWQSEKIALRWLGERDAARNAGDNLARRVWNASTLDEVKDAVREYQEKETPALRL